MTENEINIEAFKLIKLISVKSEVVPNQLSENLDNIIGIGEVIKIDKVEKFSQSETDFYGNIVSRYENNGKQNIGLNIENYKKLRVLAVELLNDDFISNFADLEFVEKNFFKWLIDIYKTKQAKGNLTNYIKDAITSKCYLYSFYFKIEALGINKLFKIGNVEVTYFSNDFFAQEYKSSKRKIKIILDQYENAYKKFTDRPLAKIDVNAVFNKAEKTAYSEVNLALNALKCVLLQESIRSHYQIFDVDFNHNHSGFSEFMSKSDQSDSGYNISLKRKSGAVPIIISDNNLQEYNKLGLSKLSEFLKDKSKSDLYFRTERAINHFAEIISTRYLHERVVKLVSFFESIIVPTSSNRAKGQTNLHKILPKLVTNNSDYLKPIINRFYDTRNKYLHNKKELPIDLMELYQFQKLGLVLILFLVDFHKKGNTLDEFQLNFGIK